MSGQRLRLTTSRPAGYRRGGQVIGNAAAPTFVERDDVTLEQALAIVRDPNIAIAFELAEGAFATLSAEERGQLAADIEVNINAERAEQSPPSAPGSEPDTAEPQGEGTVPEGSVPAAVASQAGGPDVTAVGSDASAGDAATPEPTAPEPPAAPEPAAEPTPPTSGARKKAKGTPA